MVNSIKKDEDLINNLSPVKVDEIPEPQSSQTEEQKEFEPNVFRTIVLDYGRLTRQIRGWLHPDGTAKDLADFLTKLTQDLSNSNIFKIIDNNTDQQLDKFFDLLGKKEVTIESRDKLTQKEFSEINAVYKFFTSNDIETAFNDLNLASIIKDYQKPEEPKVEEQQQAEQANQPNQPQDPSNIVQTQLTIESDNFDNGDYAKQLELGNLKEEEIAALRAQRISGITKTTKKTIEQLGISDLAEFQSTVLTIATIETRKSIDQLIKQRQPHRGTKRFDNIRQGFNKLPLVSRYAARVGLPLIVGGVAGFIGSPIAGAFAFQATNVALGAVAMRRPAQSLLAKISSSHGSNLHKLSVLEQQASRTDSVTGVSTHTSSAIDNILENSQADIQSYIDEQLENTNYKEIKEKYRTNPTPDNFEVLRILYAEAVFKGQQDYLKVLHTEIEKRRKNRTIRRVVEFATGATAALGLSLLGSKVGSMIAEYFIPTEIQGIAGKIPPAESTPNITPDASDVNTTSDTTVAEIEPDPSTEPPSTQNKPEVRTDIAPNTQPPNEPTTPTENVAQNTTNPDKTNPVTDGSNSSNQTPPSSDLNKSSGKFQMPNYSILRAKNLGEIVAGNTVIDKDPALSQVIQTLLYDSPQKLEWKNYAELVRILKSDPINSSISNFNLLRDGQNVNFSDDAFNYLAKSSGLKKDEIVSRLTNPDKAKDFFTQLNDAFKASKPIPKWSDIK